MSHVFTHMRDVHPCILHVSFLLYCNLTNRDNEWLEVLISEAPVNSLPGFTFFSLTEKKDKPYRKSNVLYFSAWPAELCLYVHPVHWAPCTSFSFCQREWQLALMPESLFTKSSKYIIPVKSYFITLFCVWKKSESEESVTCVWNVNFPALYYAMSIRTAKI